MGNYDNMQFLGETLLVVSFELRGVETIPLGAGNYKEGGGGELHCLMERSMILDWLLFIYTWFRVGVDPGRKRGKREIPNSHFPYVHYATNFTFIYTLSSS